MNARYRVMIRDTSDDENVVLDVFVDVASGPEPDKDGVRGPDFPLQQQLRAALESARPGSQY